MEKIVIPIVVGVVALAIGILVGFLIRKKIGEAKIGSAEAEAKRILEEGSKDAEAKKKEALLEAKEETLRLRKKYNNLSSIDYALNLLHYEDDDDYYY